MSLTPSPGNVDVMVASELLEAGRAMQNGFVSPERTTLIASTHRIYATMEKMQMADGRFASDRVLAAAKQLARRAVLFDMRQLAQDSGTVINAVLFGAMAGSGALPLPREVCEAAIRLAGKGAEASLRGFAAGYDIAAGARQTPAAAPQALPPETREILALGAARLRDYQGEGYARLYLERIATLGNAEPKLVGEVGRQLALWMSYEDIIRVADLKTRRSRFERVRREAGAQDGEPVVVIDYLKPGVEEVASLLPPSLGRRLLAVGRAARQARCLQRGHAREDLRGVRVSHGALARLAQALAAAQPALRRGAGPDRALARRRARRGAAQHCRSRSRSSNAPGCSRATAKRTVAAGATSSPSSTHWWRTRPPPTPRPRRRRSARRAKRRSPTPSRRPSSRRSAGR